jgi:hypothetical protein
MLSYFYMVNDRHRKLFKHFETFFEFEINGSWKVINETHIIKNRYYSETAIVNNSPLKSIHYF